MSTPTDYMGTLKKIKDTEEASGRDLLERRKALEGELRRLEEESAASVAEARKKADARIAEEVEKARASAQKDAAVLESKAGEEARSVSARKLDKKEVKKIIDDVLFSEFQ